MVFPAHDPLDELFPLGDGVAATVANALCPYCAEPVELALDPGCGAVQRYIEDCPVCCRPWEVTVRYGESGEAEVGLEVAE